VPLPPREPVIGLTSVELGWPAGVTAGVAQAEIAAAKLNESKVAVSFTIKFLG